METSLKATHILLELQLVGEILFFAIIIISKTNGNCIVIIFDENYLSAMNIYQFGFSKSVDLLRQPSADHDSWSLGPD